MTNLRPLIERAAAAHRLDPDLLHAIVRVESGGDPHAIRYEPRYPYLWDVKRERPFRDLTLDERGSSSAPPDFPALRPCSRDTEWTAQRMSWGLCQLMGAVARELGYVGTFLPGLLDPAINLEFGATLLAKLLTRTKSTDKAVQAYNAGLGGVGSTAAVTYLAKVQVRLAELRA